MTCQRTEGGFQHVHLVARTKRSITTTCSAHNHKHPSPTAGAEKCAKSQPVQGNRDPCRSSSKIQSASAWVLPASPPVQSTAGRPLVMRHRSRTLCLPTVPMAAARRPQLTASVRSIAVDQHNSAATCDAQATAVEVHGGLFFHTRSRTTHASTIVQR